MKHYFIAVGVLCQHVVFQDIVDMRDILNRVMKVGVVTYGAAPVAEIEVPMRPECTEY